MLGSSIELYSKLQEHITSKLVVISFVVQGEIADNLAEFYSEASSDFNIQAYLVNISTGAFQSTIDDFKITRVPTSIFFIGLKPIDRVEGAIIPEILEKIETLSSSFASILESIRNEEYSKIHSLVTSNSLSLFIKGTPEKPKSRRSQKMLRILNGYTFGYADISADKLLAGWLKVYTGADKFPHFFLKGSFSGSVEELTELSKTSTIFTTLNQDLEQRLKRIITCQRHVVVMMGSKEEPKCGFSERLMALLGTYNLEYETFDISIDNEVCEGLKKLSNWPTYPQVYAEGQIIGGLDVCQGLHDKGELRSALKLTST